MRIVGGSGGILYDTMSLKRKTPVTLTTTRSGGNQIVSWPTQCSTSYQVLYKDNLTDAWTPVGSPIVGDGSTKTASFPTTLNRRFYSIQTL
jgi:hypothetical protein